MKPVTKLNETHQNILNDDDNKPFKHKIKRENQGDRCFIDWSMHLDYQSSLLDKSVDWIINESGIKLQRRSVERFKRLARTLMLNFGKCLIQKCWLQIPKRKDKYAPGEIPHNYGFTHRHVHHILTFLYKNDLIHFVKGKKYRNDPQLSAYQPTEVFDARLAILSMSSTSDFDVDVVRVNKQDGPITPSQQKQIDEDIRNLTTINNYLKNHSYPFKGPLVRIYSERVGLSGRIYCEYLGIASRTLKLRQESLIDGQDVVEVDIRSSHPRIAIQEFYGECIPATFYQDIADETNIFNSKVKKYFQVALSSGNRARAYRGFLKEGYDRKDFEALESWVISKYPKVPLYTKWSLEAMNHEGELLMRVMLKGVKEDKVVLPVHDAVAVKKVDEEWAIKALKETWLEYFGYDYCMVSSK